MAKITSATGNNNKTKDEDPIVEVDARETDSEPIGHNPDVVFESASTQGQLVEVKNDSEEFQSPTSEDVALIKEVPQIPKFQFEYNNRTALSYSNQGFKVPDQHGKDSQETQFLSRVGPNEWENIIRTVTKIVRILAIDYSDPKLTRKEFIYWYENWQAKNYLGEWIAPVTDHVEGMYYEQDKKPLAPKDGRPTGYKRTGSHAVYYVEFNKKNLDDVIATSVGSDQDNIMYCVKNGPLRNDKFTYEQFVYCSLMECMSLIRVPGGPEMKPYVPA